MTLEFPADHQPFYEEFDVWRKANNNKNLPQSGVYRLLAMSPIGRLLGVDTTGTLYIGKGVILSSYNRIGKFVNALNNTESRHDGGNRLNSSRILEKYPIDKMRITITLTENPKQLESNLLQRYNEEFGEMPPFNRRMEFSK